MPCTVSPAGPELVGQELENELGIEIPFTCPSQGIASDRGRRGILTYARQVPDQADLASKSAISMPKRAK